MPLAGRSRSWGAGGSGPALVLIAGDEFGPVGGHDRQRRLPARAGGGTGDGAVGRGGAERHTRRRSSSSAAGRPPSSSSLADQLERRRRGDVPELDGDPTGRSWSKGSTRGWSACTSHSSRSPTGGSERAAHRSSTTPTRRRVSCLPASTSGTVPSASWRACPDWTRLCPAPARTAADHAPARSGDRAAAGGGAAHVAAFLVACAPRHRGASRAGEPRCGGVSAVGAALTRRSRPRFGIGGAATSSSASAPTTPRRLLRRQGSPPRRSAGFERLLREHRESVGAALAGGRRRHRGRPGAPAGGSLRALPPDGVGRETRTRRPSGRAGSAARPTAATSSGTATCSCCRSSPPRIRRPRGRCSSTASAVCPPRASWRERSAGRAPGSPGSRPRDGSDVTPASARLATGELVPIRTGELEEHIVGDVAWAAACYLDWTGDEAFAAGPGRDLIVETARYWASRVRYDRDGRAHIYGVIGPDEYHEPVDDNAFTNVIARWNLRQAAALDGRRRGRANDAGWRSRTRSSTATTGRAASTSSSPASSSSSRS